MSDILDNISEELGRLAQEQAGWIDSANDTLNAADDAAARADIAIQPNKPANLIFVNPNAPAEADDQLVSQFSAPYKTLDRALQDVRSLTSNTIRIYGDIVLDKRVSLDGFFGSVQIFGYNDNQEVVRRKITVRNDRDGATVPGGIHFRNSVAHFSLFSTDMDLDSQYARPILELDRTQLVTRLQSSDLASINANASMLHGREDPLFDGSRLVLDVIAATFTNMDGKIIEGIADGVSLDTIYWVSSNLANF